MFDGEIKFTDIRRLRFREYRWKNSKTLMTWMDASLESSLIIGVLSCIVKYEGFIKTLLFFSCKVFSWTLRLSLLLTKLKPRMPIDSFYFYVTTFTSQIIIKRVEGKLDY